MNPKKMVVYLLNVKCFSQNIEKEKPTMFVELGDSMGVFAMNAGKWSRIIPVPNSLFVSCNGVLTVKFAGFSWLLLLSKVLVGNLSSTFLDFLEFFGK